MSSSNQDGETTESKKPKDTPFSQQQLPAWQPILTPGTVLPTFFVIGIAFLAIGVGLLYFSNDVKEKVIEYTDCTNSDGKMCHDVINKTEDAFVPECKCEVPFTLEEDWPKDVYMYYALTNFYQNHRRYVKSRDEKQLLGDIEKTPDADCNPYEKVEGSELPVVPCGAIANSLFNDKIELGYKPQDAVTVKVDLLRTGIAWESDKKYKFKNPDTGGLTLKEFLEGKNKVAKPKDWKKNLWELDTEDENNNGLQNEDLIVWMRTAAFPNFRKLYRRINHNDTNTAAHFSEGLKKGNYTLTIDYNFKVKQFSGTKSVVLSQTSILGGKNPFLGIAYIVVGCICLVVGIVFLIIHIKCGKVTNDMIDMGRGGGGIRN